MTSIADRPDTFAQTALAGFCALNGEAVRAVEGGVVRATATPHGKVAVLTGGGSGHFPAFAGYVGPGLADGAVAGDVFAAPSALQVANVARMAHHGGGLLFTFGNYAGDILNFGLAAERLRAEGVDVRIVAVTDDVASAPADQTALRRGVAGDVVVLKAAGAAAEAGATLDEVERIARHANARTRSFGVAFSGCTLPGAARPLFSVPVGHMAIGLGIHGEPGLSEEPIVPGRELARRLVQPLLAEAPAGASGRVAVILNGLGRTKYEELFVLWTSVAAGLAAAGLVPVAPEVGEFVTSLDMEGCSLTLCWLDDELERLWLAPADTPGLRRGAIVATRPAAPLAPVEAADASIPGASAGSRAEAARIAEVLASLAMALAGAEDELGRLDAHAGDGDHGQGMSRGAAAAAQAARDAVAAGAGARTVLALAGDAWGDRAGGTSGALWGLALRSCAGALSDQEAAMPADVVAAARLGLEAVIRLGGAQAGDKTLVDALIPFADVLASEVAAGAMVPAAWRRAAAAATVAADTTRSLSPRLGRARPLAHRSIGHPDPGAVSLALCARVVADQLEGDHRAAARGP